MNTDIDETAPAGAFPNVPLLTIADLARLLQLSEVSVRRIIDNGMGPTHYKVGGSLRVDPKDLETWVKSGDAEKARTSRGYKLQAK
jgi:excisionase family DNA binding protein